ncbi:hypothetical protein PILCRDRAFT_9658 [Piloderma croceum F 1598]|uniref:DNA 3'-5' helicase n=1 Tax=Piloderma croceum (strain F 1598) TaxID=765440 RepID=A0A0C3BT01_PILCF|nr:hypothetical protein PILCRDRAFT_9658 [Piloderma croceum F 1598]
MNTSFLQSLNVPQLKAVQHPPSTPLQILAGPGSGKTKVLTSRIAYLILHHAIPPSSICAVTFTNKAANEMRERLEKLIGKARTGQVRMGTFHALCAGFLRKWSGKVLLGVGENFTVCDAEESKKIIKKLLEPHNNFLQAKNLTLTEGTVLSLISKAKAKGQSADDLLPGPPSASQPRPHLPPLAGANDIQFIVSQVYCEYERILRRNNCLDFDDLLLFGVKLFSEHPNSVAWCRHVLVDEFQDTNTMQYELMRYIAAAHRCVTVVGDPDQSIYGWRSAEIENLSKMRKDFRTTEQIFLEQNYRSTGSILSASLAIVAQDRSRIPKTLHTSHPAGPIPVLRALPEESYEAAFIALEIKRLVAGGGGLFGWGDVVVLLRFNALSRAIESALQKEGILSRVLGGHKFFERAEIKDLLAYLQIIDNPHFVPGFSRAINTPNRGIGDKTLKEILARATNLNLSPLSVVEQIYDGQIPDVKPSAKKKLKAFIEPLRTLRRLAESGASPADLIRRLLDLVKYEEYLKHKDSDWATRWENVRELINFATEVPNEDAEEDSSGDIDEDERAKDMPLRSFLQASMLSSEGDNDDNTKERVTISTCHAAKGLEWPIVIVPAVEQGIFPFYRSEDVEEERRLLYVACTRAQGLLYILYATNRRVGGETKKRGLSPFVSAVVEENKTLFNDRLSDLSAEDRTVLARVLGRPIPDEVEAQRRMAEFNRTNRSHATQFEATKTSTPAAPWASKPWNGSAQFYTPTAHEAPIQTFAPVSGRHLAPSHTIATNYLAPSPEPSASDFKSVTPTNHSAFKPTVQSAPNTYVPTASSQTFPPLSGRHLAPSRTIVTNSQTPSPELYTPIYASTPKSVTPANHGAKPSPSHIRPSASTKTLTLASQPLTSPTKVAMSVVTLTPPSSSSSEIMRRDNLQSSGEPPPLVGSKRRLGMGRGGTGYSNKKFKTPGL